jgi:hypothetical protein
MAVELNVDKKEKIVLCCIYLFELNGNQFYWDDASGQELSAIIDSLRGIIDNDIYPINEDNGEVMLPESIVNKPNFLEINHRINVPTYGVNYIGELNVLIREKP